MKMKEKREEEREGGRKKKEIAARGVRCPLRMHSLARS